MVCARLRFAIVALHLAACSSADGRELSEAPTAVFSTMWAEDPVDIYYPMTETPAPVALFLQGGKVDKVEYATFADELASYGFAVVIPNHYQMIEFPGYTSEGFFAEQNQILGVMDFMAEHNERSGSPIEGRIDTDGLVLAGHSYGAAVEISAVQNACAFPFCDPQDGFRLPTEVRSAAVLGINMKPKVGGGSIAKTENEGVPLAIINGRRDGSATEDETITSYNRIQHAPKGLFFIDGGNHYVMCDTNNPQGPTPDKNVQTLEKVVGAETAGRWTALWLLATGFDHQGALDALADGSDGVDVRYELHD